MNLSNIQNPWLLPEVARAQAELTHSQLAATFQGAPPAPFAVFLRALYKTIEHHPEIQHGTLLDVGCGVGHYGVLCERYFPDLIYIGSDFSIEMLRVAWTLAPQGRFIQRNFSANDFTIPDLILVGQVLEYTPNPIESLRWVLSQVKPNAHVILHRLRISIKESHIVQETTYCNYRSQNFVWNQDELLEICVPYGRVGFMEVWDKTNLTLVIEKMSL